MSELTKDGEVMRPIESLQDDASPTAASREKPLYEGSGSMLYRCVMRDGGYVDVTADGGNTAADEALRQRPGGFVMSVNPAPKGR